MTNLSIQTIILYPRPHVDTIVAVFLLRTYGSERYPGIENAAFEFMTALPTGTTDESLLAEGKIAIDIGGGKLDHHGTESTVSQLVANHLQIASNKELRKVLEWVERDEKEGKGTLSSNVLDKAFGLSGLIMALHRTYLDTPQHVIESVLPLLEAHVAQERRRYVEIPAEWESALQTGKATIHNATQNGNAVKIVAIETSSMDIAGYLRNYKKISADVVVQILPQGNVNVITNQKKNIDLVPVIRALRVAEAELKHIQLDPNTLTVEGRTAEIPEWYYDTAANTVQNGGVVPESMHPTDIPPSEAVRLVVAAINGQQAKLQEADITQAEEQNTIAMQQKSQDVVVADSKQAKDESEEQQTTIVPGTSKWQKLVDTHGAQVYEVPHYDEPALRLAFVQAQEPSSDNSVETAQGVLNDPAANVDALLFSGNGAHALYGNPNKEPRVELRDVVRIIRVEEARKRGMDLDGQSSRALSKPGELQEMPGWNFDHKLNMLIWEGPDDSEIPPQEMLQSVYAGLQNELLANDCPPQEGCLGPECYFFMYQLPRCKQRKRESNWKADGTQREETTE